MSEREIIERLERANPEEFAELLRTAGPQEEKVYRLYLGDARFERMRDAAEITGRVRGAVATQGNVVVVHGIMGGELSVIEPKDRDRVWVNLFRIATGKMSLLKLAADGRTGVKAHVEATGILKRYYGDLILDLRNRWRVETCWYDWRRPLEDAADDLAKKLRDWFTADEPVHFVAHSMGGLVVRMFAARHRKHWNSLKDPKLARGGRLVMLGTPNRGSFDIPRAITGREKMVQKLQKVDCKHNMAELLSILNTFPGTYQLLPAPNAKPGTENLYDTATWPAIAGISAAHLNTAAEAHKTLAATIDPDRLVYVAGANQPTYSNIRNYADLLDPRAYETTGNGDGRVTHELGLLDGVTTYYVEAEHGGLAEHRQVLTAIDDLLLRGKTDKLPSKPPKARARVPSKVPSDNAEVEQFAVLVDRLNVRTRGEDVDVVSAPEREAEEELMRGWLTSEQIEAMDDAEEAAEPEERPRARVLVSVVPGVLEEVHAVLRGARPPVDALSVGHYINVRPQRAELSLDTAISKANGDRAFSSPMLTQMTDRGVIRGDLAQPFLLPDPRSPDRIIAIAGMGVPGRFGTPELVVTVRELCWTLARLGKQHLATVLIGAGEGTLTVGEAVMGWLRGLEQAIAGAKETERRHITRITFVEANAAKAEQLRLALADAAAKFDDSELELVIEKPAAKTWTARINKQKKWKPAPSTTNTGEPADAERLSVTYRDETYYFSALTRDAAVPERALPLDPRLIQEVCDYLVEARAVKQQHRKGCVLQKLILPDDIEDRLNSSRPVVMIVDRETARIHWEMMASPAVTADLTDIENCNFAGIARSLTRQLRTGYAPPPEPPPPPRRRLRVLVVADPAADQPLIGAREEGQLVVDLCRQFNGMYRDSQIEVKRLIGPADAQRMNVLEELLLEQYDVLHYCGHCYFDKDTPSKSGFIFGKDANGQALVLSARELLQIDRVPRFIFANACESGVTPDRPERADARFAPSFAEAFFARGVANFICTGWPVNDSAALDFAGTFYRAMFGLENEPPAPIHRALQQARLVAGSQSDARSWGAYQHYGNPFFRFFDPTTPRRA